MTVIIPVTLALALATVVFALGREIRIRRALEKFLNLVLSRWRPHENVTKLKIDSADRNADNSIDWLR